ncbi:hypothetical protein [Actinomadura harenae]|uniref:Uncharacterized protein n=1 Tax=Actinomadura harenae TaxID=2483351 RepID=A0A3M2MA92_9ACTN|nr:hypothetical protein [Actinomadura harenae]RMI46402.1 hypothetical protein EBO15_07565 [Actinomadura harenae]
MDEPYLTEVGWANGVLRLRGRLPGVRVAAPDLVVLVRERDGDRVLPVAVVPAHDEDGTAFDAGLDPATALSGGALSHGVWDLDLAVESPDGARVVPLRPGAATTLDGVPQRRFLPGSTPVTVYFDLLGQLALDVGGEPRSAGDCQADTLTWNDRDEELMISGHLVLAGTGAPISAWMSLRDPRTGREYDAFVRIGTVDGLFTYTAAVPLTRSFIDDPLPRGRWDVHLVMGVSGIHREFRVLAPAEPFQHQVRRRFVPTRVSTTLAPDPLVITVGR